MKCHRSPFLCSTFESFSMAFNSSAAFPPPVDPQALSKEAATKTPNLYLYKVRKMEYSMVHPKSTCLSSPCLHRNVWKGPLEVVTAQSHSHTGSEEKDGGKMPFSGKSKPQLSQSLSQAIFL